MSRLDRSSVPGDDGPTVDGIFNLRDVGGWPTVGGSHVLSGRLFRAASLDAITDRGLAELGALGLRTVFDLRSSPELERHGRFPVDRLPVRWEHLASSVGPPAGDDQRSARMLEHPDPMEAMYLETMRTSGPEFARGLRILADPANLPAVAHCTSGKDRTGLFVVVIHLAIGVSLDDALAHYVQPREVTEQTHEQMVARYPEIARLPQEKAMRMAGTNTRWVTRALDSIGGDEAIPDWLASHGCDHHTQARLRTALTGD